ncbi:hypothetical protein ES702_05020 [subsurface metagenome]
MTSIEIAERILPVYLAIQRAHGKEYSFAAQETLLEKLFKYRGIKKSRATLNRWLRRLEDEGYLNRIRRIKEDAVQGMIFKSTICQIKMKGYHVLRRLGLTVWKEMKDLLNKLKYKFPGFAARETKKMLDDVKPNPNHGGNINKILNDLADNLSVS